VSVSAAASRLIKHPTTGLLRMAFFTKELHLISNGKTAGGKNSNDGPIYRAGEAPRASPFGLARLPCILRLEMYQMSVIGNSVQPF
jgi:hypothetical protein